MGRFWMLAGILLVSAPATLAADTGQPTAQARQRAFAQLPYWP